jgi:hypothetical protein
MSAPSSDCTCGHTRAAHGRRRITSEVVALTACQLICCDCRQYKAAPVDLELTADDLALLNGTAHR